MKYDIFISYRRKGSGEIAARHICELLKHDGYKVSFDNDNLRNGDFDTELLNRIDMCRDFILILSEKVFERTIDPKVSCDKDWVRIELAHALKRNKNIVPIMLDGFNKFPDNLPADIAAVTSKNSVIYSSDYFNGFYGKLKGFLTTPKPAVKKRKIMICALVAVIVAVAFALWHLSSTGSDDAAEPQIAAAPVANTTPAAEQAAKPSSAAVQKSNTQTASNNTPAKQQNPASQQSNTGTSSAPVASPAPAPSQPAKPSQQPVAQPEQLPQQQPAVVQQSGGTTQPETSASELVAKGVSAVRKFQPELAVGFFKQAVAKGSVEANYHLGELYYNGNGVDKSFPTAAGYFEKAANAGMAEAQYMLGVMYRNGQGVTKDISTAKTWLMKAAAQGNAKAEQMLNKL